MKAIILTALLSLGFCTLAQPTVVVSIHPLYDLVRQIAGDKAEVIRMLDPGASPHTFAPTPRDVVRISEADLVVLNGGLDEWLLDLVQASNAEVPVLELLTALEFEPLEGAEAHHNHEAGATHDHSGVNPHIWLDPLLMAQAVPLIADHLAKIDPENAAVYQANAKELVTELEALNADLSAILAGVEGAAFVPFHDAWPYFARRYGLKLVVEIEPSPGREPTPSYLADVLELIADSGAKAIFSEVQLPVRPAEVVAESAGVEVYQLDPLGGVEGRESYGALLRYNAQTIAEVLQ